jgi:H+/Cl- antiporter ClcA
MQETINKYIKYIIVGVQLGFFGMVYYPLLLAPHSVMMAMFIVGPPSVMVAMFIVGPPVVSWWPCLLLAPAVSW